MSINEANAEKNIDLKQGAEMINHQSDVRKMWETNRGSEFSDMGVVVGVWGLDVAPANTCQSHGSWHIFPFASSSSSSESDEESLSEGEIEALKEQVEEKKKVIATLRNQPWRMKRRLVVLK